MHTARRWKTVIGFAALGFLLAVNSPSAAIAADGAQTTITQLVTIDGVALDISGSFLPGAFHSTAAQNAIQLASASTLKPFQDLTIVAMAFGTTPPTEALPLSVAGGAQADRQALEQFRLSQTAATPRIGPTASLFGTSQQALVSQPRLVIDARGPIPVTIAEWVAEAYQHLWLVRASAESIDASADVSFLTSVTNLQLSLDAVQPPTSATQGTSSASSSALASQPLIPSSGNQLTPDWWQGTCDDVTTTTGPALLPTAP